MRRNKSAPYGYYGGVTQQNHYVPPDSPGYVPQPPRLLFTPKDKQILRDAENAAAYVEANAPNILLRVLTDAQPGNVETFMITTSGQPQDVIVYTSNKDEVILDDLAGSGIVDNKQVALDGGTF